MHGLINRSIQNFLTDSYGSAVWSAITRDSGAVPDSFEPMLTYPPEVTDLILRSAALTLRRPKSEVLEDLGTYLVSHPNLEAVRRLLRFGGAGFVDFLHSLQDLPGRTRLALDDLDLPELILSDRGEGRYLLHCAPRIEGAGFVLVGVLRAMADDYGALVLLDHLGRDGAYEAVSIHLLDQSHSTGKRFDLAPPAARRAETVGPE